MNPQRHPAILSDAAVEAAVRAYYERMSAGTRAVLAELERLSKENAKLRQAVQDRDDTLSMVIGLPGFQRRHPQFAEGILTLLAPVDVTPAPPPPDNAR